MSYYIGITGLGAKRARSPVHEASGTRSLAYVLKKDRQEKWCKEGLPKKMAEQRERVALARTFTENELVFAPRGKGMCRGRVTGINTESGVVLVTIGGREYSFNPAVVQRIANA